MGTLVLQGPPTDTTFIQSSTHLSFIPMLIPLCSLWLRRCRHSENRLMDHEETPSQTQMIPYLPQFITWAGHRTGPFLTPLWAQTVLMFSSLIISTHSLCSDADCKSGQRELELPLTWDSLWQACQLHVYEHHTLPLIHPSPSRWFAWEGNQELAKREALVRHDQKYGEYLNFFLKIITIKNTAIYPPHNATLWFGHPFPTVLSNVPFIVIRSLKFKYQPHLSIISCTSGPLAGDLPVLSVDPPTQQTLQLPRESQDPPLVQAPLLVHLPPHKPGLGSGHI